MDMTNLVLTIGLVAACSIILFLILRNMIIKKVNPQALLRDIGREVTSIITELNGTTDRNISLIEDKIKQLDELLLRADKKLSLLRRENEKLNIGKTYNDIIKRPQPVTETVVYEETDTNIKEKVQRLRKEGFSTQAIANRINMPVGEIELILSLVSSYDENDEIIKKP
jgi:fructose-specific phosphotransferase system component IIB